MPGPKAERDGWPRHAPFVPEAFDTFEFGRVETSASSNTVSLHYGLRDGPTFTEELRLEGASFAVSGPARTALAAALQILHLCAATSYYKTAVPPLVRVPDAALTKGERDLLASLLGVGLAEFRHQNRLDQRAKPEILADSREVSRLPTTHVTGVPLVPMGGGKDSLVTIESLRRHGHQPVLFVFGGHERILDVCERTGFDTVVMHRVMDPRLDRLNEQGAPNGHVPVSAIVSAAALVSAICVGADAVVMANERSASDPNVVIDGVAVNHQYSKSLEFETVFRRAVHEAVTTSIDCFSLLRRSSELRIARNFAGLTRYHDIFVSCNHAFAPGDEYRRWCCECPKCRFLFLVLAPFLSRSELVEVFGYDLLADERQVPGYLALLGVAGWPKPFDCVGDVGESRLALSLAAERPDWRDAGVIAAIRRAAPDAFVDVDQGVRDAERLDGEHFIPPRYVECAEAIG